MRNGRRFRIESPITVGIRDLSNGHGIEFGHLRDIGHGGARLVLHRALALGAPVVLLVHFFDPYNRATTIRFEATVKHSEKKEPFEITLEFAEGAQVFPGGFGEFLQAQGKQLGLAPGSWAPGRKPSASKRSSLTPLKDDVFD